MFRGVGEFGILTLFDFTMVRFSAYHLTNNDQLVSFHTSRDLLIDFVALELNKQTISHDDVFSSITLYLDIYLSVKKYKF